jgi:phosphoribosylanthranilate isomerase
MILKVCGITNQEDADVAIDAGATAIGFNFYPESPRYIAWEQARSIVTPMGIRRVGVFVDPRRQDVEEARRQAKLDTAQIHALDGVAGVPATTFWQAFQVTGPIEFPDPREIPAEAFVLDGPAGKLYGGAGRTFDWTLVKETGRRIILAGGLDASNVARAVEIARPWGVDACSRIERAPGKKDHQKMKEFLWAARMALST